MSRPSSLNYVGSGNGSIRSHTLLTPPLSPAGSDDLPYKPGHNDVTSLSMIKRHKNQPHNRNRRRLNRACASSTELQASWDHDENRPKQLNHSKSLPSFDLSNRSLMPKAANSAQGRGVDRRDVSRRRWTLSSKAQATRGLADKVFVENKPLEITRSSRDNPSPAMITLRRASTSRPTSRKLSLTFFPPPTFERSRSGLLTTFLKSMTRLEDQRSEDVGTDSIPTAVRRASATSLKSGQPEAPRKGSAPTVFTKVSGMEPSLLQPTPPNCEPSVRRCSTKFFSGGSVYEVIWDEDISTSGSESTPPATDAGSRRRSVAIDKLETQLFKATTQSRRQSWDPRQAERVHTTQTRTGSFSSFLNARLLWAGNDGGLGDSRGKSHLKRGMVEVLPEETSMPANDSTEGSIEFFPPLRSRATTLDSWDSAGVCERLSGAFESTFAEVGAWQASSSDREHLHSAEEMGRSPQLPRHSGRTKSWLSKLGNMAVPAVTGSSRQDSQRYTSIVKAAGDESTTLLKPLRMT